MFGGPASCQDRDSGRTQESSAVDGKVSAVRVARIQHRRIVSGPAGEWYVGAGSLPMILPIKHSHRSQAWRPWRPGCRRGRAGRGYNRVMAVLVLTDVSPLIGLAWVDGLVWLGALFRVVWMPPEVHKEMLPDLPGEGVTPAEEADRHRAGIAGGRHHRGHRDGQDPGSDRLGPRCFCAPAGSDFRIPARVIEMVLRRVGA